MACSRYVLGWRKTGFDVDLVTPAWLPLAPSASPLKVRFAVSGLAFILPIAKPINLRAGRPADKLVLRLADRFLFARRYLLCAFGCFAAIWFLFSIDINQGDDGAIDFVVGRAIGT